MKKYAIYFVAVAVLGFVFSACNLKSTTPKTPKLKTKIDSLNYAYGLANGDDIKQYVLRGDSTGEKAELFLKGLTDGLAEKPSNNPQVETSGSQFGSWLSSQKEQGLLGDSLLTVNYDLIRQGAVNAVKGETAQMTPEQANEYLNKTMQTRYEARMEQKYGQRKAENLQYLDDNKSKAGVVVTESGLQYQVIKQGKGKKPLATDKVKVHYTGSLIDGTVFDSSVERGEPAVFGVGQVIPGWIEGLQLMSVGSKYKFFIPYNLAYGSQERPTIPPFSTLVFEVELLGIEK